MHQDVDRYLRFLETEMSSSPNTIAAYRNDLGQFRQFLQEANSELGQIGGVQSAGDGQVIDGWGGVTRTRIGAFMVHLRDKRYAPTTIARKIAAIKSFFHYLASEGIVANDPTHNLESPKVDKTVPRSLGREEIQSLLRRATESDRPEALRDSAMVHTLWSTGVRVSELVAFDVDDLDLSAGYIRCLGRKDRERQIPITMEAQEALRLYLEVGRSELIRRQEEQALFVNHRGDRLTRQGFWLILKGRAKKAGLQSDVTPQTLRHSFALHQIDQHTDLRSLQELLGHASITTTQVYANMANDRSRLRGAAAAQATS